MLPSNHLVYVQNLAGEKEKTGTWNDLNFTSEPLPFCKLQRGAFSWNHQRANKCASARQQLGRLAQQAFFQDGKFGRGQSPTVATKLRINGENQQYF